VVFAQARADRPVDIDAWNAHAERFFATRIGFARPPEPPDAELSRARPPEPADAELSPDATHVAFVHRVSPRLPIAFIVAPRGEAPGTVRVSVRLRDATDLARAEECDARAGPTGLAILARRCESVWIVECESPSDPLALRLATILASLLLGPIMDPVTGTLFGVKTARAKLDARR
jgi:hypothetical protein